MTARRYLLNFNLAKSFYMALDVKEEVLFLKSRVKVDKTTNRALGSYDKAKRLAHDSDEGGNTWRETTG